MFQSGDNQAIKAPARRQAPYLLLAPQPQRAWALSVLEKSSPVHTIKTPWRQDGNSRALILETTGQIGTWVECVLPPWSWQTRSSAADSPLTTS